MSYRALQRKEFWGCIKAYLKDPAERIEYIRDLLEHSKDITQQEHNRNWARSTAKSILHLCKYAKSLLTLKDYDDIKEYTRDAEPYKRQIRKMLLQRIYRHTIIYQGDLFCKT